MSKLAIALGVAASIATAVLITASPASAGCRYVLLPNGQQVMSCTKN